MSLALHATAHAQSYESALLDGVAARDRAVETGDGRDWQRALEHFTRARQVKSTKEVEFELAGAALQVGLWIEAYAAYEAALELGLQGKAGARAREFVKAHAAEVARLEIQGPPGTSVYVDERKRAELPLVRPLVVRAGALALRLEGPSFPSWQRQLDVEGASLTRLELAPDARASAALPTPAPSERAAAGAPPATMDSRPWARPLLVAGGSLFLVGAVGLVTTSLLLPDARRELRALCTEADDAGECLAATSENLGAAQSAANRVETLENVRWITVSGAALGMIAATVGFVQSMPGGRSGLAEHGRLQASPEAVLLEWRSQF